MPGYKPKVISRKGLTIRQAVINGPVILGILGLLDEIQNYLE
jgi:hypothetical protein